MGRDIAKLLVPILFLTVGPAAAAEVWIGEFTVAAGESGALEVVVPVEVSDAQGVAGGDLLITYEAAVLTAVSVESGDLSSGWLLSVNLNEAGVIRVALAGSQGSTTGTGSLLRLHFEVPPEVAAGTVTQIGLASVGLNDEQANALPVEVIGDGSFTVPEGPGLPSEPVEVWIGEFTVAAGESGALEVVVPVEVSGAQGVAGGDLLITYEAAVLTAVSVESGDLSSGWLLSVNLNEAGVIRVALAGSQGSTTGTGSLLRLHFEVPPEVVAGTVTQIGLASVGLSDEQANALPVEVIGDGSLTVPEGLRPPPEPVEVWIGEFTVTAGESGALEVVVPVEVSGAQGVAGGDLLITYEAAVLTAVAVESGDVSSGWLLSVNLNEAGVIRVALAGSQGSTTGTGSLLRLHFEVPPEVVAGTVTQIGLASVGLSDEQANALPVEVIGDGSLTVPEGLRPPPEPVEVWIGEFTVAAGESGALEVVVPVEVSGAQGVAGGDLLITYEAAVLTAVAVESGDVSSGWLLSVNLNEAGVIRVALAGSQGSTTGTGSLLRLHFEVPPEVVAGTVTQIGLASVGLSDEQANALPVEVIGDGSLTVPEGLRPLTGDFDGDGEVGWRDVDAFREVFGQYVPPADPVFDLDNDGYIGFLDLFILADNFGAERAEHQSQ